MSNAVVIHCPKCQAGLRVKSSGVAEGRVTCPGCQAKFVVRSRKPADQSADETQQRHQKTPTAEKPRSAPKPQSPTRPHPGDVTIPEKPRRSPAGKSLDPFEKDAVQKQPRMKTSPPTDNAEAAVPVRKKVSISKPPGAKAASKPASAAAASPQSRRDAVNKKKKKPVDPWDDVGGDQIPWEGDAFSNGIDDPYGYDTGYEDPYDAPKQLPGRAGGKKKKAASESHQSDRETDSRSFIERLGVAGWFLSGSIAGLLGVLITTAIGSTGWPIAVSIMAVVVGPMVGGAVRFAAAGRDGWGPGIVAFLLALISIMAGKAGAFYVMLGNGTIPGETDGAFTSEQLADQAASDSALIANIADDVQQEWLESGKLTDEDLTRHFESQRNEAVERINPDEFPGGDEIDIEEVDLDQAGSDPQEVYDPSVDYPPVIWKEASDRWNAKSDEEKKQAAADARKNYLEMEKTATEVTQQFRSMAAIGAAFGNIFWPRKSLWLFIIGLGAAFRLGSRLT